MLVRTEALCSSRFQHGSSLLRVFYTAPPEEALLGLFYIAPPEEALLDLFYTAPPEEALLDT